MDQWFIVDFPLPYLMTSFLHCRITRVEETERNVALQSSYRPLELFDKILIWIWRMCFTSIQSDRFMGFRWMEVFTFMHISRIQVVWFSFLILRDWSFMIDRDMDWSLQINRDWSFCIHRDLSSQGLVQTSLFWWLWPYTYARIPVE